MGFHGSDPSQKDQSGKNKKPKFRVKTLAKELLKKAHIKKSKQGDNEALIGSEGDAVSNQDSGRSIEVRPGEETNQDCCCSVRQENGSDVHRSYCDVCGRTFGRRSRRQRHVRFSSNVGISDNVQQDGSHQKKHKKHKKLRKARKVTWKAMKTSWKYLKLGLNVIVNTPGMPTGTVNMTNIINNPTQAWGSTSRVGEESWA